MYFIKKVKKEEIEEMRKDYYVNLTAPMDDQWEEGIIPNGDFFTVIQDDFIVGYFVLDDEGAIISFYTKKKEEATEIFKAIISKKKIKKAYVFTCDPLFYKQCINLKKDMLDNSFLYRLKNKVEVDPPFNTIDIVKGEMRDFEEILNHFMDGTGISEEWAKIFMTTRINANSIIVFKLDNKIIGTGEIRPSISNSNYANIGMVVAKEFRRRGIATYIVNVVTKISIERGYKPICATSIDNIGSQKTIKKNGYECYHKINIILF